MLMYLAHMMWMINILSIYLLNNHLESMKILLIILLNPQLKGKEKCWYKQEIPRNNNLNLRIWMIFRARLTQLIRILVVLML